MSVTPQVYAKARSEIIALFGWNADSLSPDQTLRVDCAVALRLALDDLQGRIVRGESADVSRMLTASEALARLLPPAVLATPPPESHGDPRQAMWEIYKQMRERGEIGLKALPPEGGHQHRIDELEAENERLKARLAGKTLEHSDVPKVVERMPRGARPPLTWRRPTSRRRARSVASAMPACVLAPMTHRGDRRRSSREGRCRSRRLPVLLRSTITTRTEAGGITSRQMARSDRRRAVVATTGDLYDPGMHHYPHGR